MKAFENIRDLFIAAPMWGKVCFVIAVFIVIICIGELLIGDQS